MDSNKDYIFGRRSFSILKWQGGALKPIYNSGSDFEALTAKYLPDYFNASNDELEIDDRSGKKGPEPETITTGRIGKDLYAFIALERIGGIMVYNISNPQNPEFINYINSRDFSEDIKGDVSPEGLKFVSAQESPTGKALLLAAMEVSGTLAVYEFEEKVEEGANLPGDNKDPEKEEKDQVYPWRPVFEGNFENETLEKNEAEEKPESKDYTLIKAYIKGYPDGEFKPNGNITRAEAASLFTRLIGIDEKEGFVSQNIFSDTMNHWGKNSIDYMVTNGYLKGYPDGEFRPDQEISRAELTKMIEKYGKENDSIAPFLDIEEHWARDAINRAYGNGVIQGYEGNIFQPDKKITRAETVTILNNLFERKTQIKDLEKIKDSILLKVFSDVEKDFWAYMDILDGTNTHTEDSDNIWIDLK